MSDVVKVAEIVGGEAVLGEDIRHGMELVRKIRAGLPVDAVEHVMATGRLSPAEVDRVVIPRKTLTHRRKMGRLTADQSDRLIRAARVIAAAEETFGSKEKAGAWLRRPTTALAGQKPVEMLDTDEGAREVETLLGRIAHGIAA